MFSGMISRLAPNWDTHMHTRPVKITWTYEGTSNAAALGLDEVIETNLPLNSVERDAVYHASCDGINIFAYDVHAAEMDEPPTIWRDDLQSIESEWIERNDPDWDELPFGTDTESIERDERDATALMALLHDDDFCMEN
jgi:hypothetical protein